LLHYYSAQIDRNGCYCWIHRIECVSEREREIQTEGRGGRRRGSEGGGDLA
jgi:hypothetical protein